MKLPNALKELATQKIWVAWKLVKDPEKDRLVKEPYSPIYGGRAKSNTPSTWGIFDGALALAESFAKEQNLQLGVSCGVGIMFANGYIGIDLDHVILPNGELKEFAKNIVDSMNSYTEVSPSHNGLHILCKLNCPLTLFGEARHVKLYDSSCEIYENGRYFTFTGNVFGDEKNIRDCTETLKSIYPLFWHKQQNTTVEANDNWKYVPENKPESFSESDSDLLDKMFNSQHGLEIKRLYEGDITGYNSQSEADLALCNHLAFWTAKDQYRIDSLFRQSGLMRPKWNEQHSQNQTYGQMTIAKAINSASERVQFASQDKSYQAQPKIHFEGFLSYLKSKFQNDVEHFKKFSERKTGYSNLDAAYIRLYPGLYAFGAVTSLGKTTFCHQLAEQLAQQGEYVLFFSLEQTQLELATKGLARATKLENQSPAAAISIRGGFLNDAVLRAMDKYESFGERINIIECSFDTTIETIESTVMMFMNTHDVKPVVFIDYLQAIFPSDTRLSTKESVDANVRKLKKLSADHGLVIFIISSFNRQNYLTVADFESFKESGGIEYTADVVMALQLLAMNAQVFDSQNKLMVKRKFVQAAKNENPRKMELLILKNRYGKSYSRFFFEYYPMYDLFVPYEKSEADVDAQLEIEAKRFEDNCKKSAKTNEII